jgi:hypothetical protein
VLGGFFLVVWAGFGVGVWLCLVSGLWFLGFRVGFCWLFWVVFFEGFGDGARGRFRLPFSRLVIGLVIGLVPWF